LTTVPYSGTFVPNMVTNKDDDIARRLLGRTRAGVLGLLYQQSDQSLYVREIIRATGAGSGAVQRELELLEETGLVIREERGRQVFYRVDMDHPIYPDLSRLLLKTIGIAPAIREALKPIQEQISFAFLFGSIVQGRLSKSSDVDVMIIGDVSPRTVSDALIKVEQQLHREVNPSVYPSTEFNQKVRSGNHFLRSVLEQEKIMLIGGEDELKRVAGEPLAG
jgi:DNA-binding transcriptional ArsR family regulator